MILFFYYYTKFFNLWFALYEDSHTINFRLISDTRDDTRLCFQKNQRFSPLFLILMMFIISHCVILCFLPQPKFPNRLRVLHYKTTVEFSDSSTRRKRKGNVSRAHALQTGWTSTGPAARPPTFQLQRCLISTCIYSTWCAPAYLCLGADKAAVASFWLKSTHKLYQVKKAWSRQISHWHQQVETALVFYIFSW